MLARPSGLAWTMLLKRSKDHTTKTTARQPGRCLSQRITSLTPEQVARLKDSLMTLMEWIMRPTIRWVAMPDDTGFVPEHTRAPA
jgi:hypothetical protein